MRRNNNGVLYLYAVLLSLEPCAAAAESREIILNYVDPPGAALTVAILANANRVPGWMRAEEGLDTGSESGQIAIIRESAVGNGGRRTTYLLQSKRSAADPTRGLGTATSAVKLGTSIEVRQTGKELRQLPICDPNSAKQLSCRLSDLSRSALSVALPHIQDLSSRLAGLLSAKGLIVDNQAAKRVIVQLADTGATQNIDFVGMVRGKDEALSAPDAVSAFVVRLDANGGLSIVERTQDRRVDLREIKFTFEE